MSEQITPDLHSLTASIVSNFVSNNPVQASAVSDMVRDVYSALQGLGTPVAPVAEKLEPRMPIKKTVTPDYIVSLEDGKQYKSMKRHLATKGLTPEQYRAKWGLAADYPMVAANYAAARSELAKSMGLGRKAAAEAPVETKTKAPRKKRAAEPASEPEAAPETPAEELV